MFLSRLEKTLFDWRLFQPMWNVNNSSSSFSVLGQFFIVQIEPDNKHKIVFVICCPKCQCQNMKFQDGKHSKLHQSSGANWNGQISDFRISIVILGTVTDELSMWQNFSPHYSQHTHTTILCWNFFMSHLSRSFCNLFLLWRLLMFCATHDNCKPLDSRGDEPINSHRTKKCPSTCRKPFFSSICVHFFFSLFCHNYSSLSELCGNFSENWLRQVIVCLGPSWTGRKQTQIVDLILCILSTLFSVASLKLFCALIICK